MKKTLPALAAALLPLLAASAAAQTLPKADAPEVQAIFDQYRQDGAAWSAPAVPPAKGPDWSCLDQQHLYMAAGLAMAIPEFQQKSDKMTRKMMREMGMDPSMAHHEDYRDIRVVPLAGPSCADGKVNGQIEVVASYTAHSEKDIPVMVGGKDMGQHQTMDRAVTQRIRRVLHDNEVTPGMAMLTDSTTTLRTLYNDPAMRASMGDKPTTTPLHQMMYMDKGTSVSFMEMTMPKVSTGFLGMPKVENEKVLVVMVTTTTDDGHGHSRSWNNGRLTTESWTKDNRLHGPNITYMDNVWKRMGQKVSDVPGLENPEEVTVDGAEMVRQTLCFQNGVRVKMSPCPMD